MACCCSLIFIVENFLPTDSDLGRFGTCNVFFRTYGYLCCWSAQYSIISSLLGAIYPNLLLSIRRLHSNPVCFMISLRTLLYIIFMLDLTNLLIRFSITNKSIGVDWRLCILILQQSMAFLFEEDRGLTSFKDPYPHLGPGVYEQASQSANVRPAYAPFLSTDKRQTALTDKTKTTQPGPGQYEITQTIGDSGVQAYMNKSTIIVKVQGNGSSAFKSQLDRFGERHQSQVPGPGSYEITRNTRTTLTSGNKNDRIEEVRSMNMHRKVSSIPDTKTQIGVQYSDIESLAQHQQELRTRVQYRVIGPTTYDAKIQQKNPNGIKWDRNQQPRFPDSKDDTIGPGKYYRQEPKVKHQSASPPFISETIRTYFDQMIYNTNNELKAELRRRTNLKGNAQPGPGSYDDRRGNIISKVKPREFQFFGSSLERFKQLEETSFIGPGAYNINNSSFDLAQNKKNFTNATFLSSSNKEDPTQKDESLQLPGPGAYEVGNELQHSVLFRLNRGYRGHFGQKEARFQDSNPITSAGPGSYNTDVMERRRAISSSFKSNTKRDLGIKKDGPSIGQYRLDQDSIAFRQQKQSKFLKNLQKIDVQRPAFDSGQERFKEPVQDNRQRSYTLENNQLQTNQGAQVSAPFKSQAPRLAYLLKQHTPGPGKYQLDKNSWNINSFNTHYNKLLSDNAK